MYTLKKLIRLNKAAMMIRDCKILIELHHIHMVQVSGNYNKQSC